LNRFTREAAEVEIHLNKTKKTIAAADSLVEGLEGEYDRWNCDVSQMEKDLSRLPQLSLLASAFLVFLPSAAEDARRERMARWRAELGLSKEDRFDLAHFLASEREVLRWRSEGLPPDNLSVENAVCILQSYSQTPFLVDPSSRAVDWLVASVVAEGSGGGIEVTTQDDERFVLNLELAVRLGKKLLVRDVGSFLSPVLYPILRRDFSSGGGGGGGPYRTVLVGEKSVEFNENFRLFLSTRDADAELPPDAAAVVSAVNFTTTAAGLTGQLLGVALGAERPELEQRKSDLLRREEDDKLQIGKLEDFLLEQLASSSGNILENSELLDSLNETKTKAAAVVESLKESSALQENLEREGAAYQPLARYASVMFFLVSDLRKLSNMYRLSLPAFLKLYQAALRDAPHK